MERRAEQGGGGEQTGDMGRRRISFLDNYVVFVVAVILNSSGRFLFHYSGIYNPRTN